MATCPRCGSTEAYAEEVEPAIGYIECECSPEPFYAERSPVAHVYGPQVPGWGAA